MAVDAGAANLLVLGLIPVVFGVYLRSRMLLATGLLFALAGFAAVFASPSGAASRQEPTTTTTTSSTTTTTEAGTTTTSPPFVPTMNDCGAGGFFGGSQVMGLPVGDPPPNFIEVVEYLEGTIGSAADFCAFAYMGAFNAASGLRQTNAIEAIPAPEPGESTDLTVLETGTGLLAFAAGAWLPRTMVRVS